jgi:hypothetical protein
MRLRAMMLALLVPLPVLVGCNAAPKAPTGPPRRQQFTIPRRSVEEIGRESFGTAYRSARVVGTTAQFEYEPKQDGTPQSNYSRIFTLGAGAIPPTFRDEQGVQTVRLTALRPGQPVRPLIIWSMSREEAKKIPWQHLPQVEEFVKIIKIEFQDQSLADGAFQKGK